MSRLDEIRARLDEVSPRTGRQLWHEERCPYFDGYGCDCWRGDVEWLVDQLLHQGPGDPRGEERSARSA